MCVLEETEIFFGEKMQKTEGRCMMLLQGDLNVAGVRLKREKERWQLFSAQIQSSTNRSMDSRFNSNLIFESFDILQSLSNYHVDLLYKPIPSNLLPTQLVSILAFNDVSANEGRCCGISPYNNLLQITASDKFSKVETRTFFLFNIYNF